MVDEGRVTDLRRSQSKEFSYTYAGTNQTELVTQTSPSGTFQYSYGRTNQHGMPVIETSIKDGQAAYIEHDPTTGTPLFVRLSDGTVNEYAVDAGFQEMYLITDKGKEAQARDYDPFGLRTIYTNDDSTAEQGNPYTYRFGLQNEIHMLPSDHPRRRRECYFL